MPHTEETLWVLSFVDSDVQAEKTQGIKMQIQTTPTNDEGYSGYAIDSGSQRLSNELNRLLPTNEQEIKNIIRLCSLDSWQSDLLKTTIGVHVPYLVAMVNNSFKQGFFPITLRTGFKTYNINRET